MNPLVNKKNFLFESNILLLLIIIIAAFSFRIWGITFDLPHVSHPDEPNEVHRALRLGAGNFEIDRVGKGGYYYLLFIEYGIFFVILKLFGNITTVKDFMLYFFNDPTNFYIIGRATTAILGALNVWITYLIGKKIKGENVGLIAALFMALSNISVLHAHYITVDVPMTSCVLATAYFALRIYETGQLKNYIFAGFFSALSIMTKLSSAPIVFVIGLAHYFNCKDDTNRRFVSRNLFVFISVTLLTYFVGEPGAILKILNFLRGHLVESTSTLVEQNPYVGVGIPFLINYYLSATIDALGWPLFLIVAAGIIHTFYRLARDRKLTTYDILLILFPFILYTFLIFHPWAERLHNRRYILPALPFLYIFGAQFFDILFNWARQFVRLPKYILFILAISICIPQTILIVKQNLAFSKPGTNILSKNWIEQNIPEGSKIVLEGHPGAPQEHPLCPIQDKVENMQKYADEIEEESPMGAFYVRKKASVQKGKEYDLVLIKNDSPWISLDEAKRVGIQYAIVDSNMILATEKPGTKPKDAKESRTKFYHDLTKDPEGKLLKRFYPPYEDYKDDATKRNHYIEIYQLY